MSTLQKLTLAILRVIGATLIYILIAMAKDEL